MALLFADGFDHYGGSPNGGRDAMAAGVYAEINVDNSSPVIVTTNPRTGTSNMRIISSNFSGAPFVRKVVVPAGNVLGIGYGIYMSTFANNNDKWGMQFKNASAGNIITLHIGTDGQFILRSGGYNGTILAQSDPAITLLAYNHMEMKTVFDDVAGSCEIRVNGNVVMNATDLDLGTAVVSSILIGSVKNPATSSGFIANIDYDDLIIWDDSGSTGNDFFGPCRVETLFPSADTAEADWAVTGAATGYEAISEVPPDGDTSYIAAATVNDVSEFAFDNISPEANVVKGVYAVTMSKIDEAGLGNLQTSLVVGSDVSLGADNTVTVAYTYRGDVHPLNPDTGEPWTPAGINSALLRVEKTV